MDVLSRILAVCIFVTVAGFNSVVGAQTKASTLTVSFDFRNGPLGWLVGFAYWSPGSHSGDPYPPLGEIRNLPADLGVNGTGFYVQGNNYSDALIIFLKRRLAAADGIVAGQTYQVNYTLVFASSIPTGCAGPGGSPGDSVDLSVGASSAEPLALSQAAPYKDFEMNLDIGPGGVGHADGLATTVTGTISNGIPCGSTPPKWVSITRTRQHKALVNASSTGELWLLVDTASGCECPTYLYYQRIDVTLTPVSPPPAPVLLPTRDLFSGLPTNRAAAVDSVTLKKEPFSVVSAPHLNLSQDGRTRISLFGYYLERKAGEDSSVVTVKAEDSQGKTYNLAVENVTDGLS